MTKETLTIKVTLQSDTIADNKLSAALVDIEKMTVVYLWNWLDHSISRFLGSNDFTFNIEVETPDVDE